MDGFYRPGNDFLDILGSQTQATQESKASELKREVEDPFKVKLRLDRSETHTLGVVSLPENARDLKIDTFKPDDEKASLSEDNVLWKSYLNDKLLGRQFRSKKCQVDTDCYFMIVEHKDDNTVLVSPVSDYLIFEPHVSAKTQDPALKKTEDVDKRLRKMIKTGEDEDAKLRRKKKQQDEEELEEGDDEDLKRKKATIRLQESRVNFGWDYQNEELSDDDEKVDMTARTEESEDPFYGKNLTLYGHQMKTLLVKQEEEEVDEELKQFSDDDDSQVSAPVKAKEGTKKAEMTLEDRIVQFLKENNNKVTVKGILEHFNIKQKNEDFRTLQGVIQKRCTMTSEEKDGKMVKFITLK